MFEMAIVNKYVTIQQFQMWSPLVLAILDAIIHFHITAFLSIILLSYIGVKNDENIMFRFEFSLYSLFLGLLYNIIFSTTSTCSPGSIIYIFIIYIFDHTNQMIDLK